MPRPLTIQMRDVSPSPCRAPSPSQEAFPALPQPRTALTNRNSALAQEASDLIAAAGEGSGERGGRGGSGGADGGRGFRQPRPAAVAEAGVPRVCTATGRARELGSERRAALPAKGSVVGVFGRARRTEHDARPPAPWPARLSAGFRVTQSCVKATSLSTRRDQRTGSKGWSLNVKAFSSC